MITHLLEKQVWDKKNFFLPEYGVKKLFPPKFSNQFKPAIVLLEGTTRR